MVRLAASAGRPVLLILVKSLSAEGQTNVLEGLTRLSMDERQVAGWNALLQPHDAFARGVLLAIAMGQPLYGRETLRALPKAHGAAPTIAKVRAAVERFKKAGLVSKSEAGGVAVEDPLLAEYLRLQATPPGPKKK